MTRHPRGPGASLVPALLLLLLLVPVGTVGAQEPVVSWTPSAPSPGGAFTVVVELSGVEAGDLAIEAGRGAAGMEFVSGSSRPVRGALPAARVELLYRVLAEGKVSTGPIELRARGASWSFEAVTVETASAGAEPVREAAAWKAPERVYRYAAFRVAATMPDGRPVALEPFAAPGLSTFGAADGGLVALALAPGRVELPRTLPALPGTAFRPASIEVLEVGEAVRSSRAVGRFSLRLEPGNTAAVSGGAFSFTLVLEGSGSLPVVVMPALAVEGPSGLLPAKDLSVTRRDEFVQTRDGFAGRVLLDCVVLAREAGVYRARFEGLETLAPDGSARRLTVRPLRLEASAAVDPAELAAAYGRLASFLADPGKGSRAAALAREALDARASGDESAFVLALHAAERALGPFERTLGELLAGALDAREAALRLPARPRDVLPSPGVLLAAALVPLAAASALLAAAGLRAGRRRRFGPVRRLRPPPAAVALLALALVMALALGASLAERARDFAVVGPGAVRAVPSVSGGVSFELEAGTAVRVGARAGGWARVSFADGRSGWVGDEAARSYGGQ